MFVWLKRYAEFGGRSSRKEYWLGVLSFVILFCVANIFDLLLFRDLVAEDSGPVGILLVVALLVPGLALQIRRLHDTGRTGWWVLINLIPIVGNIVLIVFSVLPGEPRDNRFGPPPPETPGLTGEPPTPEPTASPA